MRALVATGTGRYADPWHPYQRTSPLIAAVLTDAGFDTGVETDVDDAMTRLSGTDLLVVNAGDPWRSGEAGSASAESVGGLYAALARGIGVIAVHGALASLRDHPDWAAAIGGMWVPGLSWHPPFGTVQVSAGALPDGTELSGFEVEDERYARLQAIGERTVVAHHDVEGAAEPTAWVRTHGASRIAVDALGHDERSWASEGHRGLLTALARWTTAPR